MAQSRTEQEAEHLASEVGHRHNLGDAPIADMFEFASHACDVDVLSITATAMEHGASMTDTTTGRTAIVVATTNNPMRQRSSIAHELGHVLFNHLEGSEDPPIGTPSPEEKLADTLSSQLFTDAVARISGVPAHKRVRDSASLGEIMAIAHASVLVQAGEDVMLLIDETDGTRRARQEWKHLQFLGVTAKLRLGTTTRLLKAAAAQDWIKGDLTRDQVYRRRHAHRGRSDDEIRAFMGGKTLRVLQDVLPD